MKRLLILSALTVMALNTAGCCRPLFPRLRGLVSGMGKGCQTCDPGPVYESEVYMPATPDIPFVQPGPAANTPGEGQK